MYCDGRAGLDAAQFGNQALDDTLIGGGEALLLSEAAQTRNFAKQCYTMYRFSIHLIPFSENVGYVRVFAVHLFIGAPIILHNMLGG